MDANITDLRSRSKYKPDFGALARNRVAVARAATGLDRVDFARMLTTLVGREITPGLITSWETNVTPPGDIVLAASSVSPNGSGEIGLRSHKFISVRVAPELASQLADNDLEPTRIGISDACTLYVWRYGSVILHLVEELEFPDITSLAFWRYESYNANMDWAVDIVSKLIEGPATSSYVLSLYWVHTPVWSGRILDSALKLICAPRVLLEREGAAGAAERDLLSEGFDPDNMRAFGVQGASLGFASWSGVSYHPFDTHRALAEDDLVAVELEAQAIWSYCSYIGESIERGDTPTIVPGYGCGFLRAARSKLLTPRPQESGAHRAMREAIVQTSALPEHLSNAMDTLREMGAK
ncbi:hypothetical protein [Nocardia sp. XZ_19_231]|uniref:hypothetical protein n=1 Tax=Nocardia sp. XZ_19_231 TaxID=2769252 RepID=UPI0018908792|nr:hypothetical protein [Nocardia sp. XZ_19_231]